MLVDLSDFRGWLEKAKGAYSTTEVALMATEAGHPLDRSTITRLLHGQEPSLRTALVLYRVLR